MKGGWTKDGKVYCMLCGRKTTQEDVEHKGAIVQMEHTKYPFCSKCVARRSEKIINAVKTWRNGYYE